MHTVLYWVWSLTMLTQHIDSSSTAALDKKIVKRKYLAAFIKFAVGNKVNNIIIAWAIPVNKGKTRRRGDSMRERLCSRVRGRGDSMRERLCSRGRGRGDSMRECLCEGEATP